MVKNTSDVWRLEFFVFLVDMKTSYVCIEYRSDDITPHFSILDTMYRWSMMKNIYSPNLVGIGLWGARDMAAWIPN